MLALNEGNPRLLRQIAERVVKMAAAGDMDAVKEIANRLDGKAQQSLAVQANVHQSYPPPTVNDVVMMKQLALLLGYDVVETDKVRLPTEADDPDARFSTLMKPWPSSDRPWPSRAALRRTDPSPRCGGD